jgi:hypothetical protein
MDCYFVVLIAEPSFFYKLVFISWGLPQKLYKLHFEIELSERKEGISFLKITIRNKSPFGIMVFFSTACTQYSLLGAYE